MFKVILWRVPGNRSEWFCSQRWYFLEFIAERWCFLELGGVITHISTSHLGSGFKHICVYKKIRPGVIWCSRLWALHLHCLQVCFLFPRGEEDIRNVRLDVFSSAEGMAQSHNPALQDSSFISQSLPQRLTLGSPLCHQQTSNEEFSDWSRKHLYQCGCKHKTQNTPECLQVI